MSDFNSQCRFRSSLHSLAINDMNTCFSKHHVLEDDVMVLVQSMKLKDFLKYQCFSADMCESIFGMRKEAHQPFSGNGMIASGDLRFKINTKILSDKKDNESVLFYSYYSGDAVHDLIGPIPVCENIGEFVQFRYAYFVCTDVGLICYPLFSFSESNQTADGLRLLKYNDDTDSKTYLSSGLPLPASIDEWKDYNYVFPLNRHLCINYDLLSKLVCHAFVTCGELMSLSISSRP